MIVPSLQNVSSLHTSSHFKKKCRFSIHTIRVTSSPMKAQFSGSCKIKSHHLVHPKYRFIGSGWKKKGESRLGKSSRHLKLVYSVKGLSHKKCAHSLSKRGSSRRSSLKDHESKLHLSAKDTSRKASWKYRKKKFVLTKRSVLKETISWKRRKKRSLATSSEFVHIQKGSSLKRSLAWKRMKKKRRCCFQMFLFYIYDWNPGIASLESPGIQPLVTRECCDCCIQARQKNGTL